MDSESETTRSQVVGKKGSMSIAVLLTLAYQSCGVVYGYLSVSPLFVLHSMFVKIRAVDAIEVCEVYGVLSFVSWTLTLIPLAKYCLIVLNTHDNGEGGTFALYALLCRHLKLSIILNQQTVDEVLFLNKELLTSETPRGVLFRQLLENHKFLKNGLLLVLLLGTCTVVGDGALTPALSDVTVIVSCIILVLRSGPQYIDTRRVSSLFAPVILAWLLCNASIGLYTLIKGNPSILRALSPYYMYYFFKKDGKESWISLRGVHLSITGADAMYADLGHFSRTSIQIAFTAVVYPSLLIGYMGQAVYLSTPLRSEMRTMSPLFTHDDRYWIGRIGFKEFHMYRCVVRYGYKDVRRDGNDFENQLVANLAEFIQSEEIVMEFSQRVGSVFQQRSELKKGT